jgi:hypothetical protein
MSFIINRARSAAGSVKDTASSAVGSVVNTTTSALGSVLNFGSEKIGSLASSISSTLTSSKKIKNPDPIDIKTIDQYKDDTEKFRKILVKKTYYVALIQGMYFAQNWYSISRKGGNFVSMDDIVKIINDIKKSNDATFANIIRLMEKYIKQEKNFTYYISWFPGYILSAIIFYYMNNKGTEKVMDDVFKDVVGYIRNFSSDSNKASSLAAKGFDALTKFLKSYNDLIKEFNDKLKLKDESTTLSKEDEDKLRKDFIAKMLKKDTASKLTPKELDNEFEKYKYKYLRDRYIINYYNTNKYLNGSTQNELYSQFSQAITAKFVKDFKLFFSESLGKKFIKSILLDNMMQCGIQNTIESLSNPAFMNGIYEMSSELIKDNIQELNNPPKDPPKDKKNDKRQDVEIDPKHSGYFSAFGKMLENTLKLAACTSEDDYHKLINSNFNPFTDNHKLIKSAKDIVDSQMGDNFTNKQINEAISLLMKETGKITLNLIKSENLEKYLAMAAENLCKVYEPGPEKESEEYKHQQLKFIENEKDFYTNLDNLLDTLYETSKEQNVEMLRETIKEHRPKFDEAKKQFKEKSKTKAHEKIDELRQHFETLSKQDKESLKKELNKLHETQNKLFNQDSFKAIQANKYLNENLDILKVKLDEFKQRIESIKLNKSKPFIHEFNIHLQDIKSQVNSTLKKIDEILIYKTRLDELNAKKTDEIQKAKKDAEQRDKSQNNRAVNLVKNIFSKNLKTQLEDIDKKYDFKIKNFTAAFGTLDKLKQNIINDLQKLKDLSNIFEDEISWKNRLKHFIDPRNHSMPSIPSKNDVISFSKKAIPALIMGYFFPVTTGLTIATATGAYLAKDQIKTKIFENLDPLADKVINLADKQTDKLIDKAPELITSKAADTIGYQSVNRYAKPIVKKFTYESFDLAQRPSLHHGLIHTALGIVTNNLKS